MKIAIFIIGTILITYFSWIVSIKEKRYHGIYRFFAAEGLLGLTLINLPYWSAHPFSIQQALSWIALALSLIMALHGFYLLIVFGKPKRNFEDTTRLVVLGVYKYIRHPLYLSLMLLGLGIFLKNINGITTAIFIIIVIFLIVTAKREEKEMIQSFGKEYISYMEKTKMFIPFIL